MGSFEREIQDRLSRYYPRFFHVEPFFGVQKSDKEFRIMRGLEVAFEMGKKVGKEEMREFIPPGSFPGMDRREGAPPGMCRDPEYYDRFALSKLQKLAGEIAYSHPVINGWRFSKTETDDATSVGRLLMLDAETSRICDLKCTYCYRKQAGETQKMEPEMPIADRKDLIDQAAELGCQTVKIVGAGEPLLDEDFWEQTTHIQYRGIVPIVFTDGTRISKDCAKRLYDLGASVMLKCNSFDPQIEDALVGKTGYTERRNEALKNLQEARFNDCYPTRLGFDTMIMKSNKGGIIDLFKYCRSNNIFPLFSPPIPKGCAEQLKDQEVPRKELAGIYRRAGKIDKKYLLFEHESNFPYIGGFACMDPKISMYIDISGRGYPCIGSNQCLGRIGHESLEQMWKSKAELNLRAHFTGCPPREGRP